VEPRVVQPESPFFQTEPRDIDLITRVARQDREAFAGLFDGHASAALGLLVRMLGARSRAEDLLQEVFLQIWSQAASYRPERSSPRGWILMIARSRALDLLRAQRARLEREENFQRERERDLDDSRADTPAPLLRLERRESAVRIGSALDRLPDEQRACIELAFFEGLSHTEIAERLGAPLGTVRSRVKLGMARLRGYLGGWG
jgi:RNA polymerase sigma-70 factor (ECF subfamily)